MNPEEIKQPQPSPYFQTPHAINKRNVEAMRSMIDNLALKTFREFDPHQLPKLTITVKDKKYDPLSCRPVFLKALWLSLAFAWGSFITDIISLL